MVGSNASRVQLKEPWEGLPDVYPTLLLELHAHPHAFVGRRRAPLGQRPSSRVLGYRKYRGRNSDYLVRPEGYSPQEDSWVLAPDVEPAPLQLWESQVGSGTKATRKGRNPLSEASPQ